MANVYFSSDLHLFHKNIKRFCPHREQWSDGSLEEDAWALVERFRSVVTKDSLLWLLGDLWFGKPDAPKEMLKTLPCRIRIIRGNHDDAKIKHYLEIAEEVYGIHQKYHYWLSHAPIHPSHLRGMYNLHGHSHGTHSSFVGDKYYDVGVDANDGLPVSLETVRKEFATRVIDWND